MMIAQKNCLVLFMDFPVSSGESLLPLKKLIQIAEESKAEGQGASLPQKDRIKHYERAETKRALDILDSQSVAFDLAGEVSCPFLF